MQLATLIKSNTLCYNFILFISGKMMSNLILVIGNKSYSS
ncbi:hypothetical protein [uncultured Gammaproteobacteria bacterium]|nr:hypothetical protein [uncultured Gammaproteobacteria bacterium]